MSAEYLEGLDENQRRAVLCDDNAVVAAGAGSGKTRVLAERYYRLIAEGKAEVDEILTLTFTRKAAAEMHRRIYGLLRRPGGNEAVRRAAERFNLARISTLDAFSASVLRSTAASYGITPAFSLDDAASADRAERLGLAFILENQDRPSLRYLVRNNGLGRVVGGFASLAAGMLPVGKSRGFPAMREKQEAFLRDRLREAAGRLDAAIGGILRISLPPEKTGGYAESVRAAQGALADFTELSRDAASAEGAARLRSAAGALDGIRMPGRTADSAVLEFKEHFAAYREAAAPLDSLMETLELQPLLRDLFALLEEFHLRADGDRRQSGVLGFADCAELAVRSLIEHPALRNHYKRKFRWIMIDEFQDNNLLQKELLYLLAEREDRCTPGVPSPSDLSPGKLFFVGDEKQSIYRFRGADVRVFKSLAAELPHSGEEPVRLDTNYRSEPGLVDFFNRLFRRVMENASADHEARFEELLRRPPSGDGTSGGPPPYIGIFCKPFAKERPEGVLDNDSAEAYFIAAAVRDWVENGTLMVTDAATGAARPAGYRDFAVLMRSTGSQMRYERMFRLHGVPYATSGIRSLFLDAPVNDFYAALQTAVHPRDRLAYAALLRSPFVNLSDDVLAEVLLLDLPPFETAGMAVPPAEMEKLGRGRGLVERIREAADVVPVPDILSRLWHEEGYRFFILRDPRLHPFLELYDYIREFALLAPGENLAAFLDRLRPNLGNYERIAELEIERDQADGVGIMTVHKSKGLEFPVVILANAGNMGRSDGAGSGIFHFSEEHGLTCSLGGREGKHNFFYAAGREEEEARDAAELKRLLYVACTRARNHLVVSGCFTEKNRKSDKAFLTRVFRALDLDPEAPDPAAAPCDMRLIPDVPEEVRYREAEQPAAVPLEAAGAEYARPPLRRGAPRREYAATELRDLPVLGVSGAGPGAGERSAAQAASPAAGEESGEGMEVWFGSLCHKVVEEIIRRRRAAGRGGPAGNAAPGPAEEAAVRAAAPLRADCPSPEKYDGLLESALRLAAGFFASPFAERLFAASGGFAEPEVPFTAKPGEGRIVVNGIMDLVFPLPEETVVVDFKTDRTEEPELHAVQMAVYRTAAEAIWGKPARTYLYYLRSGLAVLSEEPLPAFADGLLP